MPSRLANYNLPVKPKCLHLPGLTEFVAMSPSNNPRQLALEIINRVLVDGEYSNLILPAALSESRLDQRDRALATELTYGSLRRLGTLDQVVNQFLKSDIELPVRNALRLGTYQLLYMRIPAHAAVAATIDAAKRVIGHRTSGLLNAVLRKIAAHDLAQWTNLLTKNMSELEKLAFEHSYPEWVIAELAAAYQVSGSQLVSVLEAGNQAPQVDLVARPGQFEISELLTLPNVQSGRWSPLAARLQSGNPSDLPGVRSGAVGVQDEGSQLVALALTNAQVKCAEDTWLDMCAGPGGKAAILAGIAKTKNAKFVALEPSAARAKLVANSIAGLHHPAAKVVTTDARDFVATENFSRILVDAPCTGLGALRRRPEARWRRTQDDVHTLAELQGELLAKAGELVAPGGVIAYATCSPVIAETDTIVDDFLSRHPGFTQLAVNSVLPNVPEVTQRMRLRPDVHGTDGMFVALLQRNSE
jgi:16S rRNA (cytosine967-C5)-methyltransferase